MRTTIKYPGHPEKTPELSSILMTTLAANPILIKNDKQKIAMLSLFIQTILEIGELEHSSDWDPFLKIKTKYETLETISGYPDIIFGDFNQEEQDTALQHYREITKIGFYIDSEDNETYINLSDIISIEIFD